MDQLFMFSNEYSLDDMGDGATYGTKDTQRNEESSHLQNEDDVGDNDYITAESLKEASATAAAKDNDEDDNTIFNFSLEPQVQMTMDASPKRRSLRPTPMPSANSTKAADDPNGPFINYELAVVYICPACGAEFMAQDVWKRHLNSIHNYNTRRGLNFIPLDKLYHKCLECNKRIAMHAMENLLKHKFTHLPHRCTKCNICMRQYKYRQDLMVHLRTNHRAELLALTESNDSTGGGAGVGRYDAGRYRGGGGYNSNNRVVAPASSSRLEIKDIKENAIDIFENTCDSVEVKNELMEPDDDNDADPISNRQANNTEFAAPSLLEDALSRSSSHASDQRQLGGTDNELFEQHVQYICRVCDTEYSAQEQWREHIERVHDFGSIRGLGFREVPHSRTVQCAECNWVTTADNTQSMQIHKLGHLPNRAYVRCKLCFRSFAGYKEVVKHLQKQHRLTGEFDPNAEDSQEARQFGAFGDEDNDDGYNNGNGEDLLGDQSKNEERDIYEPQIDYLCPQCGKEFQDKKWWRRHIVKVHHLTDLNVLNFEVINDREVKCRECDKIITNAYGVQNAQQHRITHMPYKAFIRCRMCAKSYTDRKGLVKHLRTVHRINDCSFLNQSPAMRSRQVPPLYATPTFQSKPPRTAPLKEIVRHNDVTFEIQYLDDDSDAVLDDAPVPELSFGKSGAKPQNKCADCGAAFDTPLALRTHKQEEHEFLDFNNLKPLSESAHKQRAGPTSYRHTSVDAEQSNDGDDLLVPTGDEEFSFASTSSSVSNIDQYFCYLCPACGKEFKIQNDWRRHINDLHNFDKRQALNFRQLDRFRFQCIECHDIVSSAKLKGLQDHKFRHLPYKLYIKCLLCSTCYNHKPNMVSHLRIRHNLIDTRTPSGQLDRDYDDPSPTHQIDFPPAAAPMRPPSHSFKPVDDYISNHNAVDHDTITYYCPQCNENFVAHAVWRKHIVTEHDLNNTRGLNFRQLDEHHYLCLQCYKRVTVTHTKGAIGQLQSHKFRHLPYRSFKCLACYGLFVRKQMFFKHLNRATNRCEADRRPETVDDNVQGQSQDKSRYTHVSEFQSISPNSSTNTNARNNDDTNGNARKQKWGQSTDSALCAFSILCPQCGIDFDSWFLWREHINAEHSLGRRELLNFKKIHNMLHECLECHDCVHGKKLRDLQIHKFKHMPYGDYLRCRFCPATYYYLRNMSQHLLQKHPRELENHERTQELLQEENSRSSATVNDDDDEEGEDNNDNAETADVSEKMDADDANAENDENDDDEEDPDADAEEADNDSDNTTEQQDNDDDMVIPECEVEEVEPVEEAEEQFVLG